ncbi:hypothetical protein PDESU_02045 [Pontiella desulfatans]|jgi:hypothetical protein|uniref:NACHT domain-containing protein n=1 Tax=Pontiella desulfatans TaxID=2750659 RepID=A0A6C2U0K1_PONDE|nr:hypothetical protein [Pontiella desulfatans]VGO13488.1 hypothetical protein PDESU_02045 [Pontiella desulfatans]
MKGLGSISASKALEFLDSEEVQCALASAFPGTQTREGKKAILNRGFWVFASGAVKEAKPPSTQVKLLHSLYSKLKEHLLTNEEYGDVLWMDLKNDPTREKTREHIHKKLADEASPLGRIVIAIVWTSKDYGYRLSVMPSAQVAQTIRSQKGPRPAEQLGIASDARERRMFQIQRSAPVVLHRSVIDKNVETALSGNLADILILPGGFQSGKSTWLLDFHQRNRRSSVYYPFCEDDTELQRESCLAESLAVQLTKFTGVSGAAKSVRGVDSCAKLGEFVAALGAKLDGLDVLVLLDGIDQSGDELLGRILTMIRQYLQGGKRPLRWILTVRSPSPAQLALCSLPCSSVVFSFDEESCVLEFIQSYFAVASYDCSSLEKVANEVYELSGSNILLMRRVAHDMLEAEDVE